MQELWRVSYPIPGNQRSAIEAGIRQCASEHGGRVVGQPTLKQQNGQTCLTVDKASEWWAEWMAVHSPSMWVDALLRHGMDPSLAETVLADLRAAGRGSAG
jgi:hypothetical protein